MKIHQVLAKPVWQTLVQRPGFARLSAAAIEATDDFFTYVLKQSLYDPTAGDIRTWVSDVPETERIHLLNALEEVFSVCDPSFLRRVAEARHFQPAVSRKHQEEVRQPLESSNGLRPVHEATGWDPIAPPSRRPPVPRQISVEPWDLPEEYQIALRRAADRLPGKEAGMRVPARSMVVRMREKLCQYVWSSSQRGLPAPLSIAGLDGYIVDVIQRSSARKFGLRWATVRASVAALYLFARFVGEPDDIIAILRAQLREFEMRERGQRALKFFKLLRTGNSTDKLLDLADNLLLGADAELSPKRRHQMRNGAAILAVFANAPLRNASAQLVLGETILWRGSEWVIRMAIQKTHTSRPELFEFPLHPECGRFVDAIILGDASLAMLPALRDRALSERRQLFVLSDGTPAAATYVPRVFQALTGNSFTTLRVMHYSDAVQHHGVAGVELAKPAAQHKSVDIVKMHYIAEQVAEIHSNNLRTRREARTRDNRDDLWATFGWNVDSDQPEKANSTS
ncbi:hypothetical protein [Albibacillus kandeliae]|uniref:hypothetical protein n=1 Tax=Albibacillus kandeliae TaxID=2174228 RepID=UPI000D68632A|nr:hypothetical protein [Albibacillus kandeliae]